MLMKKGATQLVWFAYVFMAWILMMIVLGIIYFLLVKAPKAVQTENMNEITVHEELLGFLYYPVDEVRDNADLILESISLGDYKDIAKRVDYYFDNVGAIYIDYEKDKTLINAKGKIIASSWWSNLKSNKNYAYTEIPYKDKKVRVWIAK